jgi:hypothetical protein
MALRVGLSMVVDREHVSRRTVTPPPYILAYGMISPRRDHDPFRDPINWVFSKGT